MFSKALALAAAVALLLAAVPAQAAGPACDGNFGSCNQFVTCTATNADECVAKCGEGATWVAEAGGRPAYCSVASVPNDPNDATSGCGKSYSFIPDDGECHPEGPGGRFGFACCKANGKGNTAIPCAREFKGNWKAGSLETLPSQCYEEPPPPPPPVGADYCAAGSLLNDGTTVQCIECGEGQSLKCVDDTASPGPHITCPNGATPACITGDDPEAKDSSGYTSAGGVTCNEDETCLVSS